MTMFERLERLEVRVGALESAPRITLDGDGELRLRIEALEEKFSADEIVDTLLREVNALDRLVCASSDDEPPCLLDRVVALEADAKRALAVKVPAPECEHGALPCSARDPFCGALDRASGLLLRALDELDSDIHTEPITLQLRYDIKEFLARARVATEEP